MAAMSDYLENKLLDHALGVSAFTMPVTVYVALHTIDNGLEAGTITGEVSGSAYARQAVAFDIAAAGATANTAGVSFPQATGTWGTITHLSIMDASTAGNVLFHGALTASKLIELNDTFSITAGDLDVTMD